MLVQGYDFSQPKNIAENQQIEKKNVSIDFWCKWQSHKRQVDNSFSSIKNFEFLIKKYLKMFDISKKQ